MSAPDLAVLDDLIARRAFADTMRAWGENSPDPEWFKDDCLNSLLTSCGEAGVLIHALLDEITALRADASAETMRERCAAICEHQSEGYASAVKTPAGQTGDAEAALALSSAAKLIRALPTNPEGGDDA